MRWPALTLLGIALAVIVGITHAALARATNCILGLDNLDNTHEDGYAADGYGNR